MEDYNYDNQFTQMMQAHSEADFAERVSDAQRTLLRNVYVWMTLALGISGLMAYLTVTTPFLFSLIFSSTASFWILGIGTIVLVLIISGMIDRLSFTAATLLFILYSLMMGMFCSSIFVIYTMSSIASTFLIAAGTFAAMAIVGSVTKRDLSTLGRILIMALIGLIIASIVNIFVASSKMDWIITYAGVLIFTGLTAYDAQKIKKMIAFNADGVNETTQKIALLGALSLYLDFINLFLYLLRIFGKRN